MPSDVGPRSMLISNLSASQVDALMHHSGKRIEHETTKDRWYPSRSVNAALVRRGLIVRLEGYPPSHFHLTDAGMSLLRKIVP